MKIKLWILIIPIVFFILYFLIKSPISYDATPSVFQNSIIYKSKCSIPLLRCKLDDKVLFKIDETTINNSNNLKSFTIEKDDSFDATTTENKNLIKTLLRNINISIPNIDFFKIKDDKLVISNTNIIDCKIIGNISEVSCDSNYKKYGIYNSTTSNEGGTTCEEVISNMSDTEKKGYKNWSYDRVNNKIKGEQDCINSDCYITSNIIEDVCDEQSRIKNAYYNIIPEKGSGIPCNTIVSNLSLLQKKDYTNWNVVNGRLKGSKPCQPDIPCRIISNIVKNPECNVNSEKIEAYYDVNIPEGNGSSCDNLIYNLSQNQKEDYTNWKYIKGDNKIVGYKDCCSKLPDGTSQIYYNGYCSIEQCPSYLYKSKYGNMCLDSCPAQDKIDENIKKCYNTCPSNKVTEGNICKDTCSNSKYNYNGVCVDSCPSDKPIIDNNTCVNTCPLERNSVVNNTCVNTCYPKYTVIVGDTIECRDECPRDLNGSYFGDNNHVCYETENTCINLAKNQQCCSHKLFGSDSCK